MIAVNTCLRCGAKMYGEYDYRKVVCDKCEQEVNRKVQKIIKILAEREQANETDN